MQYVRACGLVALAGLLCGCQSQRQPTQEGAYVDFVMGAMVESAKLAEGQDDAGPAMRAVESWRGAGDEEGGD